MAEFSSNVLIEGQSPTEALREQYRFLAMDQPVASLETKEARERLHRWGLARESPDGTMKLAGGGLKVQRFKFDRRFDPESSPGGAADLLFDLVTSEEFSHSLELGLGVTPESWTQLEVEKLSATVLNMGFFDPLESEGLLAPNGFLRKCMNDRVHGVDIDTLVTDMLLNEESEHAHIYGEAQRNEFLFRLFQLLFIGGAMHQRDEDVLAYLEQTKLLYKDLMTVHKRSATGKVEITSRVYAVRPTATGRCTALFPGTVELSHCYIIVDAAKKLATAVHMPYKGFW